MSNDFTLVYKILRIIQKGLDFPIFGLDDFNLSKIGITQTKFENLLIMLQKDNLISGLEICEFIGGRSLTGQEIRLTIKGLEYLESNSFMKKARDLIGNIGQLF